MEAHESTKEQMGNSDEISEISLSIENMIGSKIL
jgi:hypothetical protein